MDKDAIYTSHLIRELLSRAAALDGSAVEAGGYHGWTQGVMAAEDDGKTPRKAGAAAASAASAPFTGGSPPLVARDGVPSDP